jgi:iron(III) transport system substrate-binding protein
MAAARIALCAVILFAAACTQKHKSDASGDSSAAGAGEVNVYSGRHYDSDRAIFDAFAAKTGVKVNVIEAGADALIERLDREGAASPADVFIAADAGMLWRAKARGLLQPITNPETLAQAPAQFRDPDGEWIGLSKRVRVIIVNKDAALPISIDSYDDLANPALKGAVCVRSSTNVYNQSLMAWMIETEGAEKAKAWARGVVDNFARAPEGNDTSQIEAVAAGQCKLAIVNSYYLARFVEGEDEKAKAVRQKVGLITPNQATTGAHVNVSGASVTRHAPNAANAEALIAFMLSPESQSAFAAGNNEYPIVSGVAASGPIATFGAFKVDDAPLAALGAHQAEAVRILDEVGWR